YPSTRGPLTRPARSGQARTSPACLEGAVGESRPRIERRYVFCATVLQVALTGRYPEHCPAEFGLSSPRLARHHALARGRPLTSESRGALSERTMTRESKGDRLARCDKQLYTLG